MGSVYPRHNVLWVKYRDTRIQDKKKQIIRKPTDFKVGEEEDARKLLREVEDRIAAGAALGETDTGPMTLRRWVARWTEQRRTLGLKDVDGDESRLRIHVLPKVGDLKLEAIRARHLADLFKALRASAKLAPKSIHNTYGSLKAAFRDAKIEGLIHEDPCCLTEHQLGPNVDADPEWRDTAYYTEAELVALVSDPRIPFDRHVLYALEGLGALRHGEAAGLRWKNVDLTREPLGALKVSTSYDDGRTKTNVTRHMPIHPVLQAILAEWKLSGWAAELGRQPTPDDLVCPMPKPAPGRGRRIPAGRMRDKNASGKRLKDDLTTLGFRHRRGHDLRRTLISLARCAGAREDVLKVGTHGASREVIDRYTTFGWPTICEAVACLKLKVAQPAGAVVLQLAGGDRQGARAQWSHERQNGREETTEGDIATFAQVPRRPRETLEGPR